MLTVYPACFFKDEDGYTVVFPDLENGNLATYGKNMEEAVLMAVDCLAGYIYISKKFGDSIPKPSPISDININAIEKDFIDDGCPSSTEKFVNLISVNVNEYAKEHFERSVKKTLTIPTWLNDLAIEQNINFSQVLQEALLAKLRT